VVPVPLPSKFAPSPMTLMLIVENPLNTFAHMYYFKVQKQAYRFVGQSQICQQLGFVDWKQSVHALEFNNNKLFDQ
jgi:hypothetical protein